MSEQSIAQKNYDVALRLVESLPAKNPPKKERKSLYKILENIADLIPITAYTARTKSIETVADIRDQEIKNRFLTDFLCEGPKLDISSKDGAFNMRVDDIRYCARNNRRSIRRAWESGGKNGVINYVNFVNRNNAKINSFDKTYKNVKLAKTLTLLNAQI